MVNTTDYKFGCLTCEEQFKHPDAEGEELDFVVETTGNTIEIKCPSCGETFAVINE